MIQVLNIYAWRVQYKKQIEHELFVTILCIEQSG